MQSSACYLCVRLCTRWLKKLAPDLDEKSTAFGKRMMPIKFERNLPEIRHPTLVPFDLHRPNLAWRSGSEAEDYLGSVVPTQSPNGVRKSGPKFFTHSLMQSHHNAWEREFDRRSHPTPGGSPSDDCVGITQPLSKIHAISRLLFQLIMSYAVIFFYPRYALHSAVFAVETCLCVRLLHAGIVSKRIKISSNFFDRLVDP